MSVVKEFINLSILKKQEEMEWIAEQEHETLTGFVVRRTPRTYRRVARLVVAKDASLTQKEPDDLIFQQRLSRFKSKTLSISSPVIQKWLLEGWIIKLVKLATDGRTPVSEGYLMGPALFHYEKKKEMLQEQEQENLFKDQQERLRQCLRFDLSEHLQERICNLVEIDFTAFKIDNHFQSWPLSKRMQFLEFVIAIVTLSAKKHEFDFKEIGAFYYKEIGGSKVFDRNQVDFISLLEAWQGESVDALGLVSHGRITPVYFVGDVKGQFATFNHQSLQAVTDMAVRKDHFETTNKVLWLVENRAILTRMASSMKFLKETTSIVICVDGNIRSAHRQFIEQISSSSSIEQVIIWTDYDLAGLSIAEEALFALGKSVPTKWVGSEGTIFKDYKVYKEWLHTQLELGSREQEEFLGGETQWRNWIQQ